MTKTKQQLRAEAVERLKNSVGARFKPDAAVIAIVGGRIGQADWSLECDKLIDLLTDDCGPCYSCAKLAELTAENSQLRERVDGTNGIDGETNGIASQSPLVCELPEGDAPSEFAEILMRLAADCSCMGDGIVRHFEPKDVQNDVDALMRVVERDYMRREYYYERVKELGAERDDLKSEIVSLMQKKQPYTFNPEAPIENIRTACRYIDELTAERDEWKSKAERLANDALPDENGVSDPDGGSNVAYIAQDSREKLEADVRRYANPSGSKCTLGACWEKEMLEFLDRQANITHSIDAWNIERLENRIAELQAKVQAKVDELTERLESANARNRSLRAHIAKMQEGRHGWHVKYPELEKKNAELQSDYDAIVAKCAELCALCGFTMVDINGEVAG